MATQLGTESVVKDICDALGLKNVRRLDLHFALDELVTATVEFLPEADAVDQVRPLIKHYVLTERP